MDEIKEIILRKINQLHKKIKNLKKNLEECEKWAVFHHDADLLQSNRHQIKKGMKSIVVFDWEINRERVFEIDLKKNIQDQISALYKKSRKLKKGIPFIKSFIARAIKEESNLQNLLVEIEKNQDPEALEMIYEQFIPKKVNKVIEDKSKLPYKEFISSSGFKIWIGKSAANNEILTFQYAHGSDLWLHAHDFPGSHVIIKCHGKQIDETTIWEAAKLALKYSKAKNLNEGEVIYTFQKNVRPIKNGKKGSVNVSDAKVIYIRLS